MIELGSGLDYTVCSPKIIPYKFDDDSFSEPVFRLAETEFKFFVEKLTDLFTTVDPQIPALPPKDVIYRIYRDVCLPSLLGAHIAVEIR